ncbi:Hypothetical protein GbCGDNIH2_7211 [Granulibacter bethesdensis]|nr:Hypothetical protein GbCGDNIH2_7211 [Granulibacter bethesdensis]APH51895.1 Hypothetical protein GbCGDNIH5_7211 [Granulibacter bethesdensis]
MNAGTALNPAPSILSTAMYMAGRLTDATGVAIDQKAFIQLAIGNNAAHDKVQFFGQNREGPDKMWPAADDRTFMDTGQGLAKMLPMDLVVALAEAMLNERRVERERILEIAAPFFK